MQKTLRYLSAFAVIYLAIGLILYPQSGISSGKTAIELCISSVIPALFPYLICSGFISNSGLATLLSRYLSPLMRPLFGVPGSGAVALVLGTISGYPIGAVCATDLYKAGECTKSEAERLLAFCNNSGPLFIMSVVGCGFLGSPYAGRLLYISHILAAILVGIIFRSLGKSSKSCAKALPATPVLKLKNTVEIIGGVMDAAVFTILKICGFVIFFSVFAAMLPKSGASPFLYSLCEITGGIQAISKINLDYSLKLALISFFIAFSGVSVMLQVGSVISNTDLSLKPYVLGKLLQGIFSFAITKILVSKLPHSVDTFTQNAVTELFKAPHSVWLYSICMLLFGLLILSALLGISVIRFRRQRKI